MESKTTTTTTKSKYMMMMMMMELRSKLKRASLLYLDGFLDACCLHRVVILCHRSRKLLIRTGQCFLLNGFIFLGSILVLYKVIVPTLGYILPLHCQQTTSQHLLSLLCSSTALFNFYSFLHFGLIQLLYAVWFYPLYLFSLILSTLWYNDIAKFSFAAMGRSGPPSKEPSTQNEAMGSENSSRKPVDLGGVMIGIGEQLYSLLLLTTFFLEVSASGLIPYVGKALNFLLLTWMYAYYCFEYKWNFYKVGLDRRLDFFESNWAFFAGFGSPCVLAISFFSPIVGYGVMAILFPLFVLTATGSSADDLVLSQRKQWSNGGLGRFPIFYVADTLSMRILSLISLESQNQVGNKAQ